MRKQTRFQNGKKEEITKILNPVNSGSYLFIGQKGTVVCRNSSMEQEMKTVWDLCSKSGPGSTQCRKMRMATFSVTDATFLDISGHYCIATSNRSLHFLQVTSTEHWETFRLIDMASIPLCLENNFKESNSNQTCELFVGDHVGDIYIFTFLFPRTMLFDRHYTTETQVIAYEDLTSHRDYVICRKLRNVHGDFVDKIIHLPEHNVLISNSKRDRKTSLLSQKLSEKGPPRPIPHRKGVTCFDVNSKSLLLASGSKDFLVRVWAVLEPKNCKFTLYGHCAVVADVRFWSGSRILLSVCKELEVKVWNLHSGHLLRSMLMKFSNVPWDPYLGKSILHVPGEGGEFLLVTCSDTSLPIEVDLLQRKYTISLSFLAEETSAENL